MPVRGKLTWVAMTIVTADVPMDAIRAVKVHAMVIVTGVAEARAAEVALATARATVIGHVPTQVRNPASCLFESNEINIKRIFLWIARNYNRAASFSRVPPRRFFPSWVQ